MKLRYLVRVSALAATLALIATASVPTVASATSVKRIGDTLIIGGDGKPNEVDVEVYFDPDNYKPYLLLVGEHKANKIDIGEGCMSARDWDASYAYCGRAGSIKLIKGSFRGGNDQFSLGELVPGLNSRARVVIHGGGGRDLLYGYTGNDTLYGDAGNDLLSGASGNDRLFGGGGNDRMSEDLKAISGGESGKDSYSGGGGNDTVSASERAAGKDTFAGGGGFDTISYSARFSSVSVTLDGSRNDGGRREKDLVGRDFEKVLGGGGDDYIRGNKGRDVLAGMGGDDVINSRDGSGRDSVQCDFPIDSGFDIALIDRGDTTSLCDRVKTRR